jgi:hypothetical protein
MGTCASGSATAYRFGYPSGPLAVAQRRSGRGPENFDEALGSGSAGEPAVPGEQGGVHCFGEGNIGRVINGEVVAQFPAPGQQRAVRSTQDWQRREIIQRQACAASRSSL